MKKRKGPILFMWNPKYRESSSPNLFSISTFEKVLPKY